MSHDFVKKELKKFKIDSAIIPGGCTSGIQASDVYWNKLFKSHLQKSYEDVDS